MDHSNAGSLKAHREYESGLLTSAAGPGRSRLLHGVHSGREIRPIPAEAQAVRCLHDTPAPVARVCFRGHAQRCRDERLHVVPGARVPDPSRSLDYEGDHAAPLASPPASQGRPIACQPAPDCPDR